MTTDPQAPEIAALAERIEAVLHDMIGRGATPSILVGRGRSEIATFLATALSTPLPIAPQETMREILADVEEIQTVQLMGCDPNYPAPPCYRVAIAGRCFDFDERREADLLHLAVSDAIALGQSHSTATVERELAEALKRALEIADEAAEEWDRAPQGMRAGRLLRALAGHVPGYRTDIDQIHKALATASQPVDGEGRK